MTVTALMDRIGDARSLAQIVLETVRHEIHGADWKLSVSDNGVGRAESSGSPGKGGLGTSLVAALAHQLEAKVAILNSPTGMSVSVTHATFVSRPAAAI